MRWRLLRLTLSRWRVYPLCMAMERLQILLRPDQAAHLRDVARVQGAPVTELVREAIDQALPVVGSAPDPDELEALLDDQVDKLVPPG